MTEQDLENEGAYRMVIISRFMTPEVVRRHFYTDRKMLDLKFKWHRTTCKGNWYSTTVLAQEHRDGKWITVDRFEHTGDGR